jgi:ketosteroid isomerase-like protein
MRWIFSLTLVSINPLASGVVHAQVPIASPVSEEAAVRDADGAFWRAFNACDAATMSKFFSDDVEFYHDLTGLTRSRDAVTRSMMTGPCKSSALHVRRELVAASVRYDPVPGYGAILAGDHLFYAREGNAPEKLATRARFMTLWRHQAGQWQMTRIVSYSHQPVAYTPPSKRIAMPVGVLQTYVGRYRTSGPDDIVVTLEGSVLTLRSGGLRVALAASAPDRFFAIERDLRFTFAKTPTAEEVQVEENGKIVATGLRSDAAD